MAETNNLNAPLISEEQQALMSGNVPSVVQWPEQQSEQEPVAPMITDTQSNLVNGNIPDKEVIQWPSQEVEVPFITDTQSSLVNSQKEVTAPKDSTNIQVDFQESIKTSNEIEADKLAIAEQKELAKAQEQTKVQSEFQNAVNSGASLEDLTKISNSNPDLKANFNSILRTSYKQNASLQYIAKYSWMSDEAMTDAVNNSEVVMGSDKYKLLSPEQRESFEQYYKESTANNTKKDDNKKFESDETKIISNSSQEQEIAGFTGLNIRKKSADLFTTKEITDSSATLTSKKNKINGYSDTIEGIEDDVKKQYPTLSGSAQAKIIADRSKAINRLKNTAINEYNSELGNYTRLKDNASQELDLLKYEDAQNRATYNTALGLYETRRKEKRADTAADANSANKALAASFKRQEDIEDMLFVEQNKQIATNKALVNDKILAEYKNNISQGNKKWKWEDRFDWMYFLEENWTATKVIDWGVESNKDGTKTYTSLDEAGNPIFQVYDIKGTAIWANTNVSKLNQVEADLLNTPAGSIIPTRLKTVSDTNTNRGKECAEYMNDIFTKTTWQRMWDTYASKLTVANEQTGTLGSMAVWQPNPWNPSFAKFWHAGVIVWESEDGKSWHIKSSNIKWDWVISVDEVPKDVIDWYKTTNIYDTPIEDKEYSVAQTEFLKTIDVSKGTNKEMKASISNLGLTEEDIFTFKAINLPKEKTRQFNDILAKLNNLKWDDGNFSSARWFSGAVWFGFWESLIPWTRSRDFVSDFNSFKSLLTVENLDKMSGVLTDKDLEILKSAALSIELGNSEKQFAKRLKEVENVYKKALWQEVIEPANVVFTDNQWVDYSNESLKKKFLNMIDEETHTAEEIKTFMKQENIKF